MHRKNLRPHRNEYKYVFYSYIVVIVIPAKLFKKKIQNLYFVLNKKISTFKIFSNILKTLKMVENSFVVSFLHVSTFFEKILLNLRKFH